MNATLASQILEDREISGQEKSSSPAKQPASLLSLLLLPPVALLLGLLPVLPLGLAVLVGWGVLEYSNLISTSFANLPQFLLLTVGLLPVIPAAILISMLVRPLFARQPANPPAYAISRADEPMLISFVHRVADMVGSPRPAIIELDCEPRISADFSGELRDPALRLTIGLPMILNFSQQSLGGALAREMGPFSHRAIALLKQFIQRTGSKYRWMAEWRNPTETRIEEIHEIYRAPCREPRRTDWIVLFCLHSIRALFFLVRRILRATATISRALSAFPLRHLEYHADSGQIALTGSGNFCSTARSLARLESASKAARDMTTLLTRDQRLSRDYPGLVCYLASELPPQPAPADPKELHWSSSWLAFRPSIAERIQAAYRRDDAGIFSPEKPASSLIRDPRALGEIVSRHCYQAEWGFDANAFELVSNESLNRDSTQGNRQLDEAEAFFGECLHPFRPIFPSRESLCNFTGLPEIPTTELPGQFADQIGQSRELLDRFDELVEARLNAVEFHQLALAGYPMEPGQTGQERNDPEALQSIVEFLDGQLLQVSVKLGPFEERCLRLIAVAARNLCPGKETEARLDNWFYHLAVVEQIYSVVPPLKDLATRLAALVRRQPDSDLSGQCVERFDIHMQVCELLKRIEDYLGVLPYPFEDYGSQATMWDYLTADVGTRNEAVAHSTAMANAVVDRIGEFYLRIMGQLAMDLNREPENENSTLFKRWAKLGSL